MRERIDISEIEAQTKIRAKYLRALENEEWGLLPGSTYVKTFLREYAEALGLDGRLLVEEYKLNHERPSELELQPISPSRGGDRYRRTRPSLPRGTTAILVVVGLLIVVAILGIIGGGGSSPKPKPNRVAAPGQTTAKPKHTGGTPPAATTAPAATPTRVSLQLLPTGTVYVCMVGAQGQKILNGATLTAGSPTPVYHGKRFLVTVGNGQVKMRIDGKIKNVPDSNNPINYVITPNGRHTLPAAQAPSCA